MKILKNYTFTLCLLGGILIGGICGILFGKDTSVVKPIGELFLNLMFVLIVPLVFFSISSAVCNMKQSNMAVSKVIGTIVVVFIITALIAALLAYVVMIFYNPFGQIDKSAIISTLNPGIEIKKSLPSEMLVRTFTVNDFLLLFTKSNLLPLIIFSIIFGLGTAAAKEKVITDFLNGGTNVILKMMNIIMYTAPIGLGCYFADTVGQLGGQILNGYMQAFLVYLLLSAISYFGLNSLYTFISGGKKGFTAFWRNIITPSLTAIATSSSAACIPVNIEASKKIGVPATIAETVIPLGTNINKSGSVMGGVIKVIFLLTIFGQQPTSIGGILTLLGVALLVGAVMGAIPSGGMTGELLICSVFGFDAQLAGALMIISTIIDIPATLLNSTGNVVCSMLVTRFTEGKNWINRVATNHN